MLKLGRSILHVLAFAPCATLAASLPPQHPALLTPYPARPAWSVAGVDYYVGVPPGALTDAALINQVGVTVNAMTHQVVVTGDGVVLTGIDFSTHGGWGVYVEGANDTIQNSYFLVGANNIVPIYATGTASGLSVVSNTIDGGGVGVAGDASAIWTLIGCNGAGLTVRYNWLKNAPQHIIEFHAGTLLDDHNLIESVGFFRGAHVNDVQFNGGVASKSVIALNTIYNPQPGPDGFPSPGEGIQVEAQLGGTITDTTVDRNTVIATGPALTVSYLIALHQDTGPNVLDGVKVANNYLDATGAYGPFYPPTGSEIVFRNNINLVTGQSLPAP